MCANLQSQLSSSPAQPQRSVHASTPRAESNKPRHTAPARTVVLAAALSDTLSRSCAPFFANSSSARPPCPSHAMWRQVERRVAAPSLLAQPQLAETHSFDSSAVCAYTRLRQKVNRPTPHTDTCARDSFAKRALSEKAKSPWQIQSIDARPRSQRSRSVLLETHAVDDQTVHTMQNAWKWNRLHRADEKYRFQDDWRCHYMASDEPEMLRDLE